MNPLLVVSAIVAGIVVALGLLAWFSPRRFVRLMFMPALTSLYRAKRIGIENFPLTGPIVVVCNHISWIDGVLLLWLLPRNVRFLVDAENFKSRTMNYLACAFDTILMSGVPKSIALALRASREGLTKGEAIGIFPEGTITRNGQFQGFRPGLRKIIQGNDEVQLVPCWLHGMWGSMLSFSDGKLLWKWPSLPRRSLTLYVGRPQPATTTLHQIRDEVQSLGATAMTEEVHKQPIPARQAIRSLKQRGKRMKVADIMGENVSGRDLLLRSLVLRRMLARVLDKSETYVGVLLPPSAAAVTVNLALAFDKRVAANLNYSATPAIIKECIEVAGIKRVLTSKRFLAKTGLVLDVPMVLLEDLPKQATTTDKLVGALGAMVTPAWLLERQLGLHRLSPDDLLTIIFTSGSTGTPKGVMLSHGAVGHNVTMIDQAVHLTSEDVVLGVLPFFHSFGYAVTLWSVMCLEPAGVYHINPLDARHVGKLAREHKATVLLATPTFLRGYLRRIAPEDFATMNVIVVGAEKMPADLYDLVEKRYGVRPVEGYGMTEMGPLVSVNIPPSRSHAKFQPDLREGSVGRPLPGVACRVMCSETGKQITDDSEGLLEVRGPNLMKGYFGRDDLTAKSMRDGWYLTGDLAKVDGDGFLHITGRQSRFSKIGGEMIPHGRIEEILGEALREGEDDELIRVVVSAVPDEKKGERLVVLHLTTNQTPQEMRASITSAGLPNLYLPAPDCFFVVEQIPLLGSGKLDLKLIRDFANEFMRNRGDPTKDDPDE